MSNTYGARLDRPARQLAQGTFFVLAGQAAFVAGGYLLHFYLARVIDPVAYGTYGLIMTVLTWTESALNSGVPWAVRKWLPADPQSAPRILGVGLRWQMLVGVLLSAATLLLTPWFTGAVRDSGLTFYLRLAFADIIVMALYTFYRAALNGLRQFPAQGASMAAYTVAKLASSVLLVGLSRSVTGAIVGNIVGSVGGWLAAWFFLRRASVSDSGISAHADAPQVYTGRTLLSFALPSMLFTLAGNFLTTLGLIGVKALIQDGVQVAYYSAANYLATAPTLLLIAFSLTLFPHLAGSIAAKNWPLTRAYIQSAVRYLALVLIPGTLIVLGTSRQIISILYPPHYAAAAPLLNLLLVSTGLQSLYLVFANAILAEGRTLLALSIPGALVPVSLLCTWYLTGRFGSAGAATAAVLTTALAAVAAAWYVVRRFAVRLPWASLARITTASLAVYSLTQLPVLRGFGLIPHVLLLGVVYLALLVLLQEITRADMARWRTDLAGAARKWKAGGTRA